MHVPKIPKIPVASVAVGTTASGEIWQISVIIDDNPGPAPANREGTKAFHGIFVEHDTCTSKGMRGHARDVYQNSYDAVSARPPQDAAQWVRDRLDCVTVMAISGYGHKPVAHLEKLLRDHESGGRDALPWLGPALDVVTLAAGHIHGAILDGLWALDRDELRIVQAATTPPYRPEVLSHLLGFTPPPAAAQCSANGRALWTHDLWAAVRSPAVPFDELASPGELTPSRVELAANALRRVCWRDK
jgi:hypothetical protein